VPCLNDEASVPTVPGVEDLLPFDEGGFGQVYVGREPDNDRTVAVKVVRVVGPTADAARRFERERKSMGRLSGHPSIVPLYRSGQLPDGRWYLVMPYYSAGSLASRLRDGALPSRDAVVYAQHVADALAHAHSNGVVHGDVKPANIMLDGNGDRALLTDFGIAHLVDRPTSMYAHTPGYSSPEQRWGGGVTPESDVWSLGATIYSLLTGLVPPEPGLDAPTDPAQDVGPAIGRALRRRNVHPLLVELIEQTLQRDPARRPDSHTLRQRLVSLASTPGIGVPRAAAPTTQVTDAADVSPPAIPVVTPNTRARRTGGLKVAYGVVAGAVLAMVSIGGFVVSQGAGSGANMAGNPSRVATSSSEAMDTVVRVTSPGVTVATAVTAAEAQASTATTTGTTALLATTSSVASLAFNAPSPTGRWVGSWSENSRGDEYRFDLTLAVDEAGNTSGQFHWTIVNTSVAGERPGMSAVEALHGRWNSDNGTLTLSGTVEYDPHGFLVADNYVLTLNSDGTVLSGSTRTLVSGEVWAGSLSGTRAS
jgi:hypothetical protein